MIRPVEVVRFNGSARTPVGTRVVVFELDKELEDKPLAEEPAPRNPPRQTMAASISSWGNWGAKMHVGMWRQAAEMVIDSRRRHLYGVVRSALRRLPGATARRLEYEWLMIPYAQYAFGLRRAARLAKSLGLQGFTAIEFGVAEGNGLLTLERHAAWVGTESGLRIDVVGFDRGAGLPRPTDYRDLPYRWQQGSFPMDEGDLRQQLSSAELVIGDIVDTVTRYEPREPIGFAAFDMDFHSSTAEALRLFEGEDFDRWLPRVSAYFDDVRTIDWVGERLAITEWNEKQLDRKVGRSFGTRDRVFASPPWADLMYEIHLFDHPSYEITSPDL